MEEISQQLGEILADPQKVRQIQQMAGALGLGGGAPAPAPAAPAAAPGVSPQALEAVARLAPILRQTRQEDDATRLLRALRPLLGPARQKKLDEALKILQVMRLLPLLRESGGIGELLNGLL